MSSIRPATLEDVPGAVRLFQRMMPAYSEVPPASLESFFRRALFDNPATDSQIPSLVYEGGGGRIVGFVGAQVRPMRFDGRPIRVASASHLVADPDERRPIGALLLRSFLTGRQEATVTDTATPVVTRIWLALGGRPRHLGGIRLRASAARRVAPRSWSATPSTRLSPRRSGASWERRSLTATSSR